MALLNTIRDIGIYFREIGQGIGSLVQGLKVTGKYFIKPGEVVTQKYPENRDTLKMMDNFKGELIMIHDENNEHFCTACNNCARKCPNGSIEVISKRETGPDGRAKRLLDKYIYHLEMCTFCGLCVEACEEHAIKFDQEFEHAVFDKSKLTKQLNQSGSYVKEKPAETTTNEQSK